MANDTRNDDFPTIRLDEEDRRAYQQKKQPAAPTSSNKAAPDTTPPAPKAGKGWLTLVTLLALAGCGGSGYLFTLLQKQQAAALAAENRIQQLENKLSATGEEIGESTVALQVKVTELSNRTNELWEQMDKLWASAWRRNQKEITDLGEKLTSVQNSMKSNIDQVGSTVDSQKAQLASMKTQLTSVADEILALNVQIEQSSSDRQTQTQNVKNLNDKLSVLEQRNNALSGRISQLENEIRDMATKLVSQPAS